MRACRYCGTTEWFVYSPSYSHSAGALYHPCSAIGGNMYMQAEEPAERKACDDAKAASAANAELGR